MQNYNFYFNLRSKNAKRPSTIYAIITHNSKQYKVPTDYKILPSMFEDGKCIISANYTQEVNMNNFNINENLKRIQNDFTKDFVIFANDIEKVINNIKSTQTMAKKKDNILITVTAILIQGFADYIKQKDVKESTERNIKSQLNAFLSYVKKSTNNRVSNVNKELLDGFVHDYEASMATKHNIITLIKSIINNVLAEDSKYKRYGIKKITKKYNLTKNDKRTQEEKKNRALTEKQIEAIKNLKLEGKEETARNIFMVELLSGQRISDNNEVVNIDTVKRANTIKTQKEGTKAIIINSEELTCYINKLKHDTNYNKMVKDNRAINNFIRKVAEKANLTEEYTYINANGEEVKTRLCDSISSHWGRHTFITMRLREGYGVDDVMKMSGHKTRKMVENIYSHLTNEDNENALLKVIEEKNNKENTNIETNNKENKIEEYKKVLTMFNVNAIEWIEITHTEELLRLIISYETYIPDTIGWTYKEIKELFNDATKTIKEKREILENELNNIKGVE